MFEKQLKLYLPLLLVSCYFLVAQAQTVTTGFDPKPLSIPQIPRKAPRPITNDDLIRLRDFKGINVSPDGKFVAYVVSEAVLESNSYRTALFVIGTEKDSVPKNLGSAGPARWDIYGQLDVAPQWSPDSKHITYLLKEQGTWRIWSWRREGGPPQQLTHNSEDVQDFRWSPDGTKILFTTLAPPDVEAATKKAQEGIVWDGSIMASRGRTVMQWVQEGIPRKTTFWIYDVAKKTERVATADEEAAYKQAQERPKGIPPTRVFKLARNGDVVYLYVNQDEKQFPYQAWRLYLKRKNDEPLPLTPFTTNYIQNMWWSNDEREIYFIQRVGLTSSLFSLPAAGGPARQITNNDDQLHTCSFDGQRLMAACLRENPTKPAELVLVNPTDGSIRTLAQINPEFQNISLSPPTKLEWTNKYAVQNYAYLIKPLNYDPQKRYPLIVTTYRTGGFLRGAVGDEYPIQVFAANGFVVLDFDAPPQRVEGEFETNRLRWYSPLASFEKVFELLDEMKLVDPARRGLSGLSYGADITEFAISHSDLFQAAITSGAGGRDPLFYYVSGTAGANLFATLFGGPPEGPAAQHWKEISPALNASKINAALLINAPDREYTGGLQLYTLLRDSRKPVELVVYPEEGHIKSQPKHRYAIYQRNLDWFNFWLQDKEDPDPGKRDQYQRWRSLRAQTMSKN